jgi:hypothetical protein
MNMTSGITTEHQKSKGRRRIAGRQNIQSKCGIDQASEYLEDR